MTIKQLATHVCTLGALIAVSACNNAEPVGDLVVPFEIGAGIECSLKNVTDVEISLLEIKAGVAAEEVIVDAVTVPCSEGKAEFNNIPVGRYQVRAEGFDPDKFVVVDNGGNAEPPIGEVLEGKETTAAVVNMSSTPAKLWVRFGLNKDDFQTMCSQIVMTQLAFTAYKGTGTDELLRAVLPCDATPTEGSYHVIADAGRDLDGSELDYIRVQPLDAGGQMIGKDIKYPLAMTPGAGRTVKITFSAECTADKCDLQCNGGACTQD